MQQQPTRPFPSSHSPTLVDDAKQVRRGSLWDCRAELFRCRLALDGLADAGILATP
jgi:hypothetical protein